MPAHREITYADELLSDNTVHRRYSDGRQEWRSRTPAGTVSWQDNQSNAGIDEPLSRALVKRVYRDGTVIYGREGGFGRTLWGDGVLTVNRSSFGGRLGLILAAMAGGALLVGLAMPPASLTAEQEDELRRRQAQTRSSGSDDESGEFDWDDDAADDGGPSGSGGDFG
jgi:hypothetical protein